jgi:hypothetical protein
MLSRLHPFSRRLAGLLVALLIGATALPPALHADMDDLACQFGAARSARATHVDANDTQAGSLHCEVCHWLRSIRVFEAAGASVPTLSSIIDAVNPPSVQAAISADLSLQSSRAPPLC